MSKVYFYTLEIDQICYDKNLMCKLNALYWIDTMIGKIYGHGM